MGVCHPFEYGIIVVRAEIPCVVYACVVAIGCLYDVSRVLAGLPSVRGWISRPRRCPMSARTGVPRHGPSLVAAVNPIRSRNPIYPWARRRERCVC